MLSVRNLEVTYDNVVRVLRGVSLEVPDGAVVALLGANGAGKSTLLRSVSGLLRARRGDIVAGEVHFDGARLDQSDSAAIVRAGVTQVLEGRQIFAEMTVEDNLRVGAHTNSRHQREGFDRVYGLFPILQERRHRHAGLMSGGEQQMLAIGRALMSSPRLLLLDEPSLGLAPKLVEQLRELILEINAQGVAILIVEQNAAMALSIANHGYVMESGRIVMDAPSAQLAENEDVREFYLGVHASGALKSFRDVKHYKRRKRWLS